MFLVPATKVRLCDFTPLTLSCQINLTLSNIDDCNKDGFHSFLVDGGTFAVHSGGSVSIFAADTNVNNIQASNLSLYAGNGTSLQGGSGGDVSITAGTGSGGEIFPD